MLYIKDKAGKRESARIDFVTRYSAGASVTFDRGGMRLICRQTASFRPDRRCALQIQAIRMNCTLKRAIDWTI